MSIHIGFQSDSYTQSKFSSLENKLLIDTYYDSNVIALNTAPNSTEKTYVNYKNRFLAGITSNTYIIHNLQTKENIIELSSNLVCNTEFFVKDLISTSSNTTIFTSNVICQFKHPQNRISIYNNTQTIFEITPTHTTVNNIKVSDTIYTDKIVNNTGSSIQIVNPTLIGLTLQSFNTEENVIVRNIVSKYYTTPTLLINRFDNYRNIIEIGTCNIRNSDVAHHLTLNRQGMLGIGSAQPDAPLSISAVLPNNPYIFKYTGSNINETAHINTAGYIGIGTTSCKGMLHIFRGDTSNISSNISHDTIRKDPLIKLDIAYNSNYNIATTSNVSTYMNKDNYRYVVVMKKDRYIDNNLYNYNIYHNFYLLNDDASLNYSNMIYNSNSFRLTNNNPSIPNPDNDIYTIENKFYYPSSIITYERPSEFSYNTSNALNIQYHTSPTASTSNTSNFITSHYFNHAIVLMSRDTYNNAGYITDANNPRYNADRFQQVYGYYSNVENIRYTITNITNNVSSNFINNIHFSLKMYMENVNHPFAYNLPITPITYSPPYFLLMSSNDTFKAALSSSGTLSLGTLDSNEKYILHADGLCCIKNAEIDKITTSKNSLDFSSVNISNITMIYASSNFIDKSYIQSCQISNAYIHVQESSNIQTSNLIFNSMQSSFLVMQASNVHITTPLSIAKDNNSMEKNPNTLIKVSVHDKLTSPNTYYKHYRGTIITNSANTVGASLYNRLNPSISIIGFDNSIPYVNLSRMGTSETTDYFMRINNRTFASSENTDVFELCCDNINIVNTARISYYNTINTQPSFMNHYKKFNLLTLGELNNVCVQCTNNYSIQSSITSTASTTFTNGTNKIAIGFPFGLTNNFTIQDWPQYFNSTICDMNSATSSDNKYAPYMLNVFGNVSIASIHGKNILTARVDDGSVINKNAEAVSIVVGTLGDTNTTMTLHGNLVVKGAVIYNTLEQSSSTGSDSNIKTDLAVIENALEKIKSISGYTFSNLRSGLQETGLIAQEVEQILPQAVHKSDILYLAYGNMMGIVVESIKELDKKITLLHERLDQCSSL